MLVAEAGNASGPQRGLRPTYRGLDRVQVAAATNSAANASVGEQRCCWGGAGAVADLIREHALHLSLAAPSQRDRTAPDGPVLGGMREAPRPFHRFFSPWRDAMICKDPHDLVRQAEPGAIANGYKNVDKNGVGFGRSTVSAITTNGPVTTGLPYDVARPTRRRVLCISDPLPASSFPGS